MHCLPRKQTACFNTQPPKGGWTGGIPPLIGVAVSTHSRLKAAGRYLSGFCPTWGVSTHSRLKAAGLIALLDVGHIFCFNTQPPKGGWV